MPHHGRYRSRRWRPPLPLPRLSRLRGQRSSTSLRLRCVPENIQGRAVEEHVRRLTEQIMPLVERFNRMGREGLEALGRLRHAPSFAVERAKAINVVLAGQPRSTTRWQRYANEAQGLRRSRPV